MICEIGSVESLIFNEHSNQRENWKKEKQETTKQNPSSIWSHNLGEGNMLKISKAFILP